MIDLFAFLAIELGVFVWARERIKTDPHLSTLYRHMLELGVDQRVAFVYIVKHEIRGSGVTVTDILKKHATDLPGQERR